MSLPSRNHGDQPGPASGFGSFSELLPVELCHHQRSRCRGLVQAGLLLSADSMLLLAGSGSRVFRVLSLPVLTSRFPEGSTTTLWIQWPGAHSPLGWRSPWSLPNSVLSARVKEVTGRRRKRGGGAVSPPRGRIVRERFIKEVGLDNRTHGSQFTTLNLYV